MLTREQAGDIFERIRRLSRADDVEVLFSGTRFALTRFANNTIHQNVAEENTVVSVRPVFGGRTARATTNRLDDESLRRVVKAAEDLASIQEPDLDMAPMLEGRDAGAAIVPKRYFEETAGLSPADRAQGVAGIVNAAQRHKLTTAGIFSNSENVEGIFNSRGVNNWHSQTLAEISITMLAGDSSGWQKRNAPDVRLLDPAALGEAAAEKAIQTAHPMELVPGKYTVVLEPAAVLDITGFMFWDFAGLSLLDQRSFLNNRIGKKLFGENITIWDDVAHPLQTGASFDGEGLARQRVPLIENGTVQRVVYARATAEKMRKSERASAAGPINATGHGFPLPNEMGEAPMNIVYAPVKNSKTIEQMIASTERGVYVTRFWYIREVEPYEQILTGMTRDGTYLIEKGKLAGGLRNFRFNESLIQMLSNVEEMSEPVRSCGEESFDMVVPAMKVRDFNFTEVTKF